MTRFRQFVLFACGLCVMMLCGIDGCGNSRSTAQPPPPPSLSTLQRATDGIAAQQAWYSTSSGLYQTTGWWNSANALTVLVDYARVANTHQFDSVLANTFAAAQAGSTGHAGFINRYYDDEGWWALAWIDAFDLTGNQQYLAMSESIFTDMMGGWDTTCGGGVWWSKDRTYKNAIANELFLSVAAHLANRDLANRSSYLDWANREWNWFRQSGMINAKNLVNDGLAIQSSGCVNNGKTTWTYNQGVILGGLAELSRLSPDPSLPQSADAIATAATTLLVDSNGILHDSCEPNCGADGVQFKGIFVRNLVALYSTRPQPPYRSFITANADAIWSKSQGPNFQFGQVWSGPFAGSDAGIQSSALDALVGAAIVENIQ